jgi:hypothetical protein
MLPQLNPLELGVVAAVLIIVMNKVLTMAKDIVMHKLSGGRSSSPSEERERIQRNTKNDRILEQLAASMEKQVVILQRMEILISAQSEAFREFVHHFHEHEKDMLEHKN